MRKVTRGVSTTRYWDGHEFELHNWNYGPGGLYTKAEAQKHARQWCTSKDNRYRIVKYGNGYLLYVN